MPEEKTIKKYREKKWIRDSLLLRKRSPSQTLKDMFELIEFGQKISRYKK